MARRINTGTEQLEGRLLLTTIFVDDDALPATGSGTVGDPYSSIQTAIDAASAGDEVHVAPGTYAENLSMRSNVNVVGAGAEQTTIQGVDDINGVVNFDSIVNSELAGFTITIGSTFGGRGVVFEGSTADSAILKRNVITGVQYGSFVWTPARPTIINNTFASDGTDEQGIYIGNSATDPLIRNNIITGYSFAGIHVVDGVNTPTPILENNDVFGNTNNYHAVSPASFPDQTGINGNISADPQYVSAADFHLQAGSPAIDAGHASTTDPDGSAADLGAFPFMGSGATDIFVDDDAAGPGDGSEGNPFPTIQAGINAAVAGDRVVVAAGVYNENLLMKSGVDVLGSGGDVTKLIGAGSVDGAVKFHDVVSATLSGFHITIGVPVTGLDRGVVFSGTTNDTARLERTVITDAQFGVFVDGTASPTIENNTLVGVFDEVGLHINDTATVRNNIITGYGRAGIFIVDGSFAPNPIVYNTVHNNGFDPVYTPRSNYLNIADQTGSNGNLDGDPLFVDAPAFHLQSDSPAINSGDPATPADGDTTRADQGAYAFGMSSSALTIDTDFVIDDAHRVPFELFSVTTTGTIEAEVNYSGGSHWTVVLTGRRRDGLPDPTMPYAEFTGASPINISYDVTADDLARGVGWRLVVIPNPADVGAEGSIDIFAPLHEPTDAQFQAEKIALRSGEHWPSAVLTADFQNQLNAPGSNGLHGFVTMADVDCDDDFVLNLEGVDIQYAHPRGHQFGAVEQGVNLSAPGLNSVAFFTPLEPEDKVDPHILLGDYANFIVDPGTGPVNHVLQPSDVLSLTVSFAEDTRRARIDAILAAATTSATMLDDIVWAVTLDEADLLQLASFHEVEWIEAGSAPRLFENDTTRQVINVDAVHAIQTDAGGNIVLSGGLPVYDGFTGNGIIVGIDDSGIDATHNDLNVVSDRAASAFHGTHVAGIVAASGVRSSTEDIEPDGVNEAPFLFRGMAPEAGLIDSGDLVSSVAVMSHIQVNSLDVSNHSHALGSNGNYNSDNRSIDRLVAGDATVNGVSVPRRPQVFSAGNAGSSAQYGDQFGYFATTKQMKNAVVVGNWNAYQNQLAGSSSMGPTFDGRLKPDVVAPGTFISSTAVDRNEVHRIRTNPNNPMPTSGTFTLTFTDGVSDTTDPLNWNATAAEIQTELVALNNIVAGDVNVTGGPLPAMPISVQFQGNFANTNVVLMTAADINLDTGFAPQVFTGTGGAQDNGYGPSGGTSMAAPVVTGVHALMLEAWQDTYSTPLGTTIDAAPPLPSTLRAVLAQTATDIVNADVRGGASGDIDSDSNPTDANGHDAAGLATATAGPDFATGWGLIDAEKALDLVTDATTTDEGLVIPNRIVQGSVTQDEEYTFSFVVDQQFITDAQAGTIDTLKVTMAWDDPASSSTGISTDIRLINDLDLELIAPDGEVFYPWQLGHRIVDEDGNVIADDSPNHTRDNIRIDRPHINEPDIDNNDFNITLTNDPANNSDYVPQNALTGNGVWVARKAKDHLNNIEQVHIDPADLQAGHWTARIVGFDFEDGGAQDFSVVGMPYPDTAELIVKATNKVGISAIGTPIPVNFDVTNDGGTNTPAGVNIDYRVLLSGDFFVGGDVELATGNFAPLNAGASTTVNTNVTIAAADLTTLGIGDVDGDGDTDGDDLVASGAFLLVQVDVGTGTPADPNNLDIGEVLEHNETNVEFLQLASLVDVVLVFDRSGSMGEDVAVSTGVRPKIDVLKDAANLFLDLMRVGAGHDRLGEVRFNAAAQTIFATGPDSLAEIEDAADIASAKAPIAALSATGFTDVIEGLEEGLGLLMAEPDPNPRQVIIFFSDGMHTESGDPTADVFLDQFDAANVGVYSVGFGSRGASGLAGLDSELLEELSNRGDNGFFHVTDVTPELSKFFVNAVAGAVDSQVVVDPVDTISAGDAPHTVDLTIDGEASSATFVLAWDNDDATLELEVVTPAGTVIKSSNVALFGEHAELVTSDTHAILKVDLPILSGAQQDHEGTWQMRIVHSDGVRTEYSASAISESTIRVQMDSLAPNAGQSQFLPGDSVPFDLSIKGNGAVPISAALSSVTANFPLTTWGNLLSAAGIAPAELAGIPTDINGEPISLQERMVRAYAARIGDDPLPLELLPYGSRTFDLISDREGGYAGAFNGTQIEGTYNFTVDVHGISNDCGPFQRQLAQSVSVGLKVERDPGQRPPIVIDIGDQGGDTVTVTVTPVAPGGFRFGPGLADDIFINVNGTSTGPVVDNMDGSYSQEFTVTSPSVTVDAELNGDAIGSARADRNAPKTTSAFIDGPPGGDTVMVHVEGGDLGKVRAIRLSPVTSALPSGTTTASNVVSASEAIDAIKTFDIDTRTNAISFRLPTNIDPGRYLVHIESDSGLGASSLDAQLLLIGHGGRQAPAIQELLDGLNQIEGGDDTNAAGLVISEFQRVPVAITSMLDALLDMAPGRTLDDVSRQDAMSELIDVLYVFQADPTKANLSLPATRKALSMALIDSSFQSDPFPGPTPVGEKVEVGAGPAFVSFGKVTAAGETTIEVSQGPNFSSLLTGDNSDALDPTATLNASFDLSTTARFDTKLGVDVIIPLHGFDDIQNLRAFEFDTNNNRLLSDVTIGLVAVNANEKMARVAFDDSGNLTLISRFAFEDTGTIHFDPSRFDIEAFKNGGLSSSTVNFGLMLRTRAEGHHPVVISRVPSVSISQAQASEGDPGDAQNEAVFNVTLSSKSLVPVTLDYRTVDDTAKGGAESGDYQTKTGSLTFAAGETTKQISVSVFPDFTHETLQVELDETFFVELDETFFVKLDNVRGAFASRVVVSEAGRGTIVDDDPVRTFTRDFDIDGDFTVPYELFNVVAPGRIEIQVDWTGSANDLTATLTGRRRAGLADPAAPYANVTGASPLTLMYDVTPEDVERGIGWSVHLTGPSGKVAQGTMTFTVPTDPTLEAVLAANKVSLRSGDLLPTVDLHTDFVTKLAATPGGLHGLITQNAPVKSLDKFGIHREAFLTGWNSIGLIDQGAHPTGGGVVEYITPLEAEDKIDPDILFGNYNAYSVAPLRPFDEPYILAPDGSIFLSVVFWQDTHEDEIQNILAAHTGDALRMSDTFWIVQTTPGQVVALAEHDAVSWVEGAPAPHQELLPRVRATLNADQVQQVTNINVGANTITYNPNGFIGRGINIGIHEDNSIDTTHDDLNVVGSVNADATLGQHATHVAGIAAGNGVRSTGNDQIGQPNGGTAGFDYRGVAPGAGLINMNNESYNWAAGIFDFYLLPAADLLAGINNFGLDISNHSHVFSTNGRYQAADQLVDQEINGTAVVDGNVIPARPQVFAAGNNGANNPQPGHGNQAGLFSVTHMEKNGIVVGNWNPSEDYDNNGAINNVDVDGDGTNDLGEDRNGNGALDNTAHLAHDSSMGPAYDGRIRPDIVAPGTFVFAPSTFINEIQRISLAGTATGGTWTITINGNTTGNLTFNATNAQVQAAIVALPGIAAGDIIVDTSPYVTAPHWIVEYTGNFAGQNQAQLTVTDNVVGAVVNVQTDTQGTPGDAPDGYEIKSGTSMAAPAVAGVVSQLMEQWQTTYLDPINGNLDTNTPLPATWRALLIQTATDIDNTNNNVRRINHVEVDADSNPANGVGAGQVQASVGPDYVTGFGLVNAQAASNLLAETKTVNTVVSPARVVQDTIIQGQERDYEFVVDQAFLNTAVANPNDLAQQLKVTLAWDDVAATPAFTPAIDANGNLTGSALVNDLDLEIIAPDGTTVHLPWQLGHTNVFPVGHPQAGQAIPDNQLTPGTAFNIQIPQAPTQTPAANNDYIPVNLFTGGWVAGRGRDHLNNVEQVVVPANLLQAGGVGRWTVRVTGFDVEAAGHQSFSLVGMPYPDLADLVPNTPVRVPITGYNQDITVPWIAQNQGTAAAAASEYQIFLSSDFELDGTDIALTDLDAGGNQDINALAIGGGQAFNSRINLDAGVQAQINATFAFADAAGNNNGTVEFNELMASDPFILVQVDSDEDVLEHKEQNNVGFLQAARLVDVVLVFDDSGSMDEFVDVSTGQRKKIDLLKDSANLFLDLIRQGDGDRMAEVRFSQDIAAVPNDPSDAFFNDVETIVTQQTAGNIGALTAVTAGSVGTARTALTNKLNASGGTNIEAGLERGLDLLTAQPAIGRRVLILLSDGMDTAGSDPVSQIAPLAAADVNVYAVGFGTEGGGSLAGIDTALLTQLAGGTDGFKHVTSQATSLDKFFVQAVAGAVDQQVIVDPIRDIGNGGTDTVPVPVGEQDSRVSFILTWDDPDVNLELAVRTPSGTEINAGNIAQFASNVTREPSTSGKPHEIITIDFPFEVAGHEIHTGNYEMVIRHSGQNHAGAANTDTVEFSASAIGDSTVRLNVTSQNPPGGQYSPGDGLPVQVSFHGDDFEPITGGSGRVIADIPLASMGNLLSAGVIAPAELAQIPAQINGEPLSQAERFARAFEAKFGHGVPRGTVTFDLDEGQGGAYTGGLTAGAPGSYSFTIRIDGEDHDCFMYARETTHATFVGNPVAPDVSVVNVTSPGGNIVVVTVTPLGVVGDLIGPGHANSITIGDATNSLNPASGVVDNFDGSYSQTFNVAQGTRKVDVQVNVLGVDLTQRSFDVGLGTPVVVGPGGVHGGETGTVTITLPGGSVGDVTGVNLIGLAGSIVTLTGLQFDTGNNTVTANVPNSLAAGQYRVQVESEFAFGMGWSALTFNVTGKTNRELPTYVTDLGNKIDALLGLASSSDEVDENTRGLIKLGELLRDVRLLPGGSNLDDATRQGALDEITALLLEGNGKPNKVEIPHLIKLRSAAQIDSRFIPNIRIDTTVGKDVEVDTRQDVKVRFGEVTDLGETFVQLTQGPIEFGELARGRTFQTYDVLTTAKFDPEDMVEVEIKYDDDDFADETNLKVYHKEGDQWFDRTHSHDPDNNIIVALTNGLSPFVIMDSTGVPQLSINDVSEMEGDSTNMAFTFDVSLSTSSTEDIMVDFTTTLGTAQAGDVVLVDGQVMIPAGETQRPVTILVPGDNETEVGETFIVTLGSPIGATINDGSGTGTILNDDGSNVTFILNGRGRVSDFIDISSLTSNTNLGIELRQPDGTLLSVGPDAGGRISLAGFPAGSYEVLIDDDQSNLTLAPNSNFGLAEGEPMEPVIDLDGNGDFLFQTDGIILLAHSLGLGGTSLEPFRASGDTRTGAEIDSVIAQLADAFDIDGSGAFSFSTDGIILLAHSLGLQGSGLEPFRGTGANRDGAAMDARLGGLFSKAAGRGQSPDQSSVGFVTAVSESFSLADRVDDPASNEQEAIFTFSTSSLADDDEDVEIIEQSPLLSHETNNAVGNDGAVVQKWGDTERDESEDAANDIDDFFSANDELMNSLLMGQTI